MKILNNSLKTLHVNWKCALEKTIIIIIIIIIIITEISADRPTACYFWSPRTQKLSWELSAIKYFLSHAWIVSHFCWFLPRTSQWGVIQKQMRSSITIHIHSLTHSYSFVWCFFFSINVKRQTNKQPKKQNKKKKKETKKEKQT